MKKLPLLKVSILMLTGFAAFGQANQNVNFGIATHSLVNVDASTLTFAFTAPTVAGDGLSSSATASTNLKYSYMPNTPVNGNNGADIKVHFQNVPNGLAVKLTVDASAVSSLSAATYGKIGTVTGSFASGVTLGNGQTAIIENIGASYTGSNAYGLTYEATISNYEQLAANPTGGTPIITYTIVP